MGVMWGVFSSLIGRWDCIDVGCANGLLFAHQALRSNANCLMVSGMERKSKGPAFSWLGSEIW